MLSSRKLLDYLGIGVRRDGADGTGEHRPRQLLGGPRFHPRRRLRRRRRRRGGGGEGEKEDGSPPTPSGGGPGGVPQGGRGRGRGGGAPDDLIRLAHLHEPSVVHALWSRYRTRRHDAPCAAVYTGTGPILLAVNPFRRDERGALYGDERERRAMAGMMATGRVIVAVAVDAFS